MDAVNALPSPHTKAPAPRLMWIWKLNPLPMMSSPSSPAAAALSMATCKRFTASGYSART